MVKLINFVVDGNYLSFVILIEGDEHLAYTISVDKTSDLLPVVSSNVPEDYKVYERQARSVLKEYKGQELPSTITSAWC